MEILLIVLATPFLFGLPGFLLLAALPFRGMTAVTRAVLSVALSLVIVPFYFVTISNFIPLQPNLWTVLPLIIALGALAWWRRKASDPIALRTRHSESVGRKEAWFGWLWVLGFSVLINLPRLDFLLAGSSAAWGISGDEYWHLCELVSVAGSGLPPRHYFFPDLSLVYYYWSWIYPALLANLQPQWFAPARSLVLQAWMQTFAFVGLAWLVLCWNVRSRWGRLFGLWAITIAGGFDFFPSLSLVKYEDWQLRVPWLVSTNQVSSFPNIYMWVPQHVAGGMAFLLAIALWRNVRGPGWLRGIILGMLAAFCLGTSAFVFLSAALAFLLWLILYRRLWRSPRNLIALACAAPVFAVGAWYTLLQSIGRSDSLLWNSFRVPVLEGLLHTSAHSISVLDQIATWLGFPVIGFWVLLVELGLPFLLYAIWIFFHGFGNPSRWKAFLTLFPLAFLLLTFLITDSDPGRNFITRGMIPAEIAILLGAAEAFAVLFASRLTGLRRVTVAYAFAAAMLVQMVTPVADIRDRTMQAVGVWMDSRQPVEWLGITVGTAAQPFPAKLSYLRWVNEQTPIHALIVEYGPLEDSTTFRLLQRTRYLVPSTADQLNHLQTDLDLLSLPAYETLRTHLGSQDPLTAALTSSYVRDHQPPIYTVLRDPAQTSPGELVYRDEFVRIFKVS